jgi:cytidyltransferase-like protein
VSALREIVMVDGCFDPLHDGHISYFFEATKFGLPVICSCQTDNYIWRVKRRVALLSENQRLEVIKAIRYIDSAFLIEQSTLDTLRTLKPKIYFKGHDWFTRGLPPEEMETCLETGISVQFASQNRNSSTQIVKRFLSENLSSSQLEK